MDLVPSAYREVPFRRFAVASVKEPRTVSPTSALQRGHEALSLSHLSTQSLWKRCVQGSSRSSSLFTYFAKQIQQAWLED